MHDQQPTFQSQLIRYLLHLAALFLLANTLQITLIFLHTYFLFVIVQ